MTVISPLNLPNGTTAPGSHYERGDAVYLHAVRHASPGSIAINTFALPDKNGILTKHGHLFRCHNASCRCINRHTMTMTSTDPFTDGRYIRNYHYYKFIVPSKLDAINLAQILHYQIKFCRICKP